MNPRFVSPILAAALLGGACSSSDGSAATSSTAAASAPDSRPDSTRPSTTVGVQDSSTAPSSTSTPPATTAPAPSTTPATTEAPPTTADGPETTDPAEGEFTDAEAIDRSDARTALITLSVFPDDWIEDPIEVDGDDDPGTDEFEAEFDACLGRDDDDQVGDELDRLKVSTGDFHPVENDTTTVSHEVVLAADVDTALAAMAEVRVDGAEPCLADVIGDFYRTEFADDPELADVGIGEVIVTRTEDDSDPDLAVGVLLEVPLTIRDQTVSQFLELLYQRQGRALSELSFSSFGGQFDRDGYTVLSDEVIVRLAAIGN